MGIKTIFDKDKAIECILFVSNYIPDFYPLLKVLYLSDKLHLERYGLLITNDNYVAMEKGPVPSGSYDIIKSAIGYCGRKSGKKNVGFRIDGYSIQAERQFRREYLSDSDYECLFEIADFYKDKQWLLKDDSHDAYKKSWRNDEKSIPIPIEDIVMTLPDGGKIMDHIWDKTFDESADVLDVLAQEAEESFLSGRTSQEGWDEL